MATRTTRSRARADSGNLTANELDRLALSPEVAWYLRDRGHPLPQCPPTIKTPEPGDVPGARFDPQRVDRVIRSFRLLRHTQGQWAGRPLVPDPWQVAYVLAPTFGWVTWDDDAGAYVRIISSLYVDVPRKNGKSTLSGAVALYLTCADGEPGAQVVTAATSERQAGFVFGPLKLLAEKSPALKPHVKAHAKRIVHPSSGSYVEVVASVAEAQHGANIHGAVIDELHVHRTGELVEAIETGTGSRRQPLVVIITTADDGRRETIYDRRRTRVEQLANGTLRDPTTYGVVWCVAEGDDPHIEEAWSRANPGYGTSPTRAYMARASAKAKDSPAELASFQRLHLGVRTNQATRYLKLDEWDRNAGMVVEHTLAGRVAYGGIDLGATSDLTSLALLFPDDQGGYDVLWRFWAPEASLVALNKRTANAAGAWVRQGLLTLTQGNVTDYEFVKAQVLADLTTFSVAEIGFDPWNATDITNRLTAEGAPLVHIRQGYASLSPPLKEIKRLLTEGTEQRPMLRHGGHPIARWMLDNLAVAMDPAGNVKPDKASSADKIDGVSAMTTAMARAMHHKPPRQSAYEDDDLEVV